MTVEKKTEEKDPAAQAAEAAKTEEKKPAAAGSPEDAPLHKGLAGEIRDPKELAEYTKEIEKKLVEVTLQAQAKGAMPGNQPTVTTAPEKKSIEEEIEDEIFTDPKGALKKYRESILQEVQQVSTREKQVQQFWNDFYEENHDLRGLDRIVKLIEREKAQELAPLKISEARKKLADEVRKAVKLVEARQGTTTEELPEKEHTTLGGGGAPGGGQKKGPAKVLSFVEEMRQFQRSRGKR